MEQFSAGQWAGIEGCRLFRGVSRATLTDMLTQARAVIRTYEREEIIALEGHELTGLGVLLTGRVQAQHTYQSGISSVLATLGPGDSIGEAVIFSQEPCYPATIVAVERSTVLFIPKRTLAGLLHNSTLMTNFIGILSDRIVLLSGRIRTLSYHTLRQRIADHLLTLSRGSDNTVDLRMSRREMAESMGVARPSLSRELSSMRDDGLLDFDKSIITIRDVKGLLACLEE